MWGEKVLPQVFGLVMTNSMLWQTSDSHNSLGKGAGGKGTIVCWAVMCYSRQ